MKINKPIKILINNILDFFVNKDDNLIDVYNKFFEFLPLEKNDENNFKDELISNENIFEELYEKNNLIWNQLSYENIYEGNDLKDLIELSEVLTIKDGFFNKNCEKLKSDSRQFFSKLFDGTNFYPKTIITTGKTIDEILPLIEKRTNFEYPLIGKPDRSHSGIGIQVFNNQDDLKSFYKSKKSSDVISEFVNVHREFRLFLYKDEIIEISQRIILKGIEKKKSTNDNFEFDFVPLDKDYFFSKFEKSIFENIIKKIRKKIKLDIWTIDFMEDSTGNFLVSEIDSQPEFDVLKIISLVTILQNEFNCFVDKEKGEEFSEYLEKKFLKKEMKNTLKKIKKYKDQIV